MSDEEVTDGVIAIIAYQEYIKSHFGKTKIIIHTKNQSLSKCICNHYKDSNPLYFYQMIINGKVPPMTNQCHKCALLILIETVKYYRKYTKHDTTVIHNIMCSCILPLLHYNTSILLFQQPKLIKCLFTGIIYQYKLIGESVYDLWYTLNQTVQAIGLMDDNIKDSVVFGTEILPAMMHFLLQYSVDYCRIKNSKEYQYVKESIMGTIVLFVVFYNCYVVSKKSKKQQIMYTMLKEYGFTSFNDFFVKMARKADICILWDIDDDTIAHDLCDLLLTFNLVKHFHDIFFDHIIQESTTLYRVKWYYTRCGNILCNKLRVFASNGLKKCVNCKCIRYCSRKCQKIDWKNHKQICSILRRIKRC